MTALARIVVAVVTWRAQAKAARVVRVDFTEGETGRTVPGSLGGVGGGDGRCVERIGSLDSRRGLAEGESGVFHGAPWVGAVLPPASAHQRQNAERGAGTRMRSASVK